MKPSQITMLVLTAAIFAAGWFAGHLAQPTSAQAAVETKPVTGVYAVAPTNEGPMPYVLIAGPDGHLWLTRVAAGKIVVVDEHTLTASK
jgi:streptogramin lyase